GAAHAGTRHRQGPCHHSLRAGGGGRLAAGPQAAAQFRLCWRARVLGSAFPRRGPGVGGPPPAPARGGPPLNEPDLRRLRLGEIVAGASAALLLVFMFALPWYGLTSNLSETASHEGAPTSWNGWNGLLSLRWLLLVTIVAALALA